MASGTSKKPRPTSVNGVGVVLVAVYAILAVAAIGRSVFQILTKFDSAPLAYLLSAAAAAVYLVITISLLVPWSWVRVVTWIGLGFELGGVLVVGTLSVADPGLFPSDTVWSVFGRGYLFIPLVLPLLGIWWMLRNRRRHTVVTIGKFDGLHIGHMELIREVVEIAQEERLQSVVVTFDRHPAAVVKSEDAPIALAKESTRLRQLRNASVERVEVLEFDDELAAMTPAEFVERVLVERLRTRVVVVGEDFRFGHNAAGTIDTLRDLGVGYGIRVVVAEDVKVNGRRVSSSWIREALEAGDIELATALLGRPPSVVGEVVHGLKRGRELGFPTANLGANAQGYVPADGVYASWVVLGDKRYPSSVSIGLNPTFGDVTQRSVEAFLIDANIDLYGKVLEIQFVQRLRGMIAFPGVDPLIEQMHDDVRTCREILLG